MTDADPAKRIPKSLGTETTLIGTYSLTDLAVALFPGVAVVLITQLVLPRSLTLAGVAIQTLTLPLGVVAIGVGALFVYLTPAHVSSLDWASTAFAFRGRTRETDHEGSREVPRIERVDTEQDVLERRDGALLGVLRVTPPSMALATDEAWARAAESFADACNTAIEFPVQLYATTRAFPVEAYLDTYRARLDDPDVKANPRLAALIEEYVAWYAADLDARRMTIRDHYVIVPITPAEVRFQRESLLQRLAGLPVVGLLARAWGRPPQAEVQAALVDGLEDRLTRVEGGLREVDGCGVTRVPATDAAALVREFWADQHPQAETTDAARFRRTPFVTAPGASTQQPPTTADDD
jgi:hypothetical protein